jgi:hypothetical protein
VPVHVLLAGVSLPSRSLSGLVLVIGHVAIVRDFPAPSDHDEFYRCFMLGVIRVLVLQMEATSDDPRRRFVWTPVLMPAKAVLVRSIHLAHPDPAARLSQVADTLCRCCAAGASRDRWQPLAFFSQKLLAESKHYSAFDNEPPSTFLAICQFPFMAEWLPFTSFEDHLPLVMAVW